MQASTFPLALLLWCAGSLVGAEDPPLSELSPSAKDRAALVAQCQKMATPQFKHFIQRLGEEKQFALLAVVYQSELPNSSEAAGTACMDTPPDKAAAFCSQFEVGSPNWCAAFGELFGHPKKAVIGYIKSVMATTTGITRARCYCLCGKAGWDDFMEEAKHDLNDNTDAPVWGVNYANFRETVGFHAGLYINTIVDKRKEAVVDRWKWCLWPFDFFEAPRKPMSAARSRIPGEEVEWQTYWNSEKAKHRPDEPVGTGMEP